MGKGGNAYPSSRASYDNPPLEKEKPVNANMSMNKNADQSSVRTPKTRWYNRGGIQGISTVGMGISVVLVPLLFATSLSPAEEDVFFFSGYCSFTQVFVAVLCFNIVSAIFVHRMRSAFCVVCVPTYMASLLTLFTLQSPILPTCAIILLAVAWRVGVCMSVCLHRYAAHGAFKCGPSVQFVLNLLGCAANQGGPIWWASQHKCHHKYCDVKRDPHSALLVGTERAFSFFLKFSSVEEEFAPKHNDNWYLRLVDTWCFAVVWAEMLLAYKVFGRDGLFISYTSLWMCQTITLWFNVANHPVSIPKKCKAASYRVQPEQWYPAFQLLHLLHPLFATIVGEKDHDDHHKHSMLAKRGAADLAYYVSILPLHKLGLVWDVKQACSK